MYSIHIYESVMKEINNFSRKVHKNDEEEADLLFARIVEALEEIGRYDPVGLEELLYGTYSVTIERFAVDRGLVELKG